MQKQINPVSTFSFKICFIQAWDIYRKNIGILVLTAIIYMVLLLCSLNILTGVVNAGLAWMLLCASRYPDKKARLADFFSAFVRIFPLTGIFFLQTLFLAVSIFGLFILLYMPQWTFHDIRDVIFLLFIISGSIVYAMLLYVYLINMDKRLSIMDTFYTSIKIVKIKGIGKNLVIFLLAVIFPAVLDMFEYSIFIKILFLLPFTSLLIVSAYRQQTEDEAIQDTLFDLTIR